MKIARLFLYLKKLECRYFVYVLIVFFYHSLTVSEGGHYLEGGLREAYWMKTQQFDFACVCVCVNMLQEIQICQKQWRGQGSSGHVGGETK